MPSWEEARKSLDQEQAQKQANRERFNELAEDAVHRLVRVLDPRVRQFVQTLHDHNQWPMESRQIEEKKKEKKGLLFTRFEERTVTKTVTEPSVVRLQGYWALSVSSNQEWSLLGSVDVDEWKSKEVKIFTQTAEGTKLGNVNLLFDFDRTFDRYSGNYKLSTDLDSHSNKVIEEMVKYLRQRDLPLPSD